MLIFLNLKRCKFLCFYLLFLTSSIAPLSAQNNLVTNPGFEDILDCEILFGEVEKAPPWKNIDQDFVYTPDLFHGCAVNSFYTIPAGGCNEVFPKSGEGMVAMVNLHAEEGLYTRLNQDLPFNKDILVQWSVIPKAKCGSPMELLCYSNTPCLGFSDIQFQSQSIVLESDTIISETELWTTMQTCYQANGSEKYVLLGNYKSAVDELRDCDNIDENNFSYYYIDDVIVAPFDVVPDTLFLCGDENKNLDASFYELPISWSDGLAEATRLISEPGFYTVMGEVEDCFLTDNMVVIRIPDEDETFDLTICENGELTLSTEIPAIWPDGKIGRSHLITRPGRYTADLQNECGARLQIFNVEAQPCNINYYVPNAFSPNNDGLNDQMEFFFNSEFEFKGELRIYDRWGNLMASYLDVDANNLPIWDGTFKEKEMNPGVFVWIFSYRSLKDGIGRVESGDFVLLR